MKQLTLNGFYTWSIFSEMRQIDFNGHLWTRPQGNILIDPVPMSDADLRQLEQLGGARLIVVTNRDHEREADAFRKRFGAEVAAHEADAPLLSMQVDRTLKDGEEVAAGMRAVRLENGKSPGEIALHFPEHNAVLAGDLIAGEPMGRLSMLPDEKLANPAKAALELRKILRLQPDAILVGDGHSIFHDANRRLVECLQSRSDVYINRINMEELEEGFTAEIGHLIGAQNLGYMLWRLEPGQFNCPFHFHHFDEEAAIVMEGECLMRTDRGEFMVRKGDFIAFPPGRSGAHQFINNGSERCVLFLLGEEHPHLVCEYPDSEKIVARPIHGAFRKKDAVGYWDGEERQK